jgi:DNA polymerase-3 subunit alpha
VRAGALDSLGPNRASLMAALPRCLQVAEQGRRAEDAGQNDMFGLADAVQDVRGEDEQPEEIPEWDEPERLAAEKETLGLYLTGHPIYQVEEDLKRIVSTRIGDLLGGDPEEGGRQQRGQRNVRVAGLAVEMRKRGGRMQLTLDDRTGRIEVTLFEEGFNRFRHLLGKDAMLVVDGRVGFDEFIGGYRITAREIIAMDEAREAAIGGLVLLWESDGERSTISATLGCLRTSMVNFASKLIPDELRNSRSVRSSTICSGRVARTSVIRVMTGE